MRLKLAVVALIGGIFIQPEWSFGQQAESREAKVFTDAEQAYTIGFWTDTKATEASAFPIPELSEDQYRTNFARPEPTPGQEQIFGQVAEPLSEADINQIPFRHGGKLFFTIGNNNYSCSAQYTADMSVVLTAAHCVRAMEGTWATNVLFVQGYWDSQGRRVAARCLSTWSGWVTGGNNRWQYDYAFLQMAGPSNTGHFGMRTNWSYNQVDSIGYPGAIAAGQRMQVVRGSIGSRANNVVELIHGVAGFTFGASGGAWVGDLTSNGTGPGNYAVSVNSHIYSHLPGRIYGPYFNNQTPDLFRYAQNGCR